MIESIRNLGEFEGVKAKMQRCGCALTRVLLWPMRTPLKHRVASRNAAIELGKVVTRFVTDFKSGRKPKHTSVLKADFIGERNRCSINTITLRPTVAFNTASKPRPRSGYKKGTLRGGTPHPLIGGIPQKFFLIYLQSFSMR